MTAACNVPLGATRAVRLVERLELERGRRALDAGCGTGAFLVQLTAATGASGLGLDRDAASIDAAREAARAVADAHCHFEVADLRVDDVEQIEPSGFDAAVCLGATHAFGDGEAAFPNALDALARLVRPGGRLLVGEGYWKRAPDPAYLEFLGEPVGIYRDHAGNVAFAEARGLVPLHACTSTDDEWDDFEWGHRARVEAEALGRPEDADTRDRLARSRAWRDGYLRWGRDTMGFGFYLFART